jgi:predicted GNAT family N-acyltransferase
LHVLASLTDGTPVGTGRLLPDGHIGRMAVRRDWRGEGVGGAMLGLLIEEARERGHRKVALNAQVTALSFYQSFGFSEQGERFMEAGLVHQAMELAL